MNILPKSLPDSRIVKRPFQIIKVETRPWRKFSEPDLRLITCHLKKQIVHAVSSMPLGVPRTIDEMLDIFLWDYFNVEGKKAVLRCVETLINDREVPLVYIRLEHEAPSFMRI